MVRFWLGLVVSVLPFHGATVADEITDQLEQARRYYEAGDVPGAIEELEFAVQSLRGRIGEQLLATFPEAPAGWTAAPASEGQGGSVPFMGGTTMLSRTYRQSDGAGIEAQLMTGGGFLQGLAGMFLSPQLLAAQPNARRVRIGQENAVLTVDQAARTAQLVLEVGGKATIMLEGSNLADGEPLVALARAWDLETVRRLVGS